MGPKSAIDKEMHARLLNWAKVMRGGLPEYSLSRPQTVEELTPDELDAQEIEGALVVMRVRRKRLYQLARAIYLPGQEKIMVALCDQFRCSERKIYEMQHQLYVCLDGILSGMAARQRFGELA